MGLYNMVHGTCPQAPIILCLLDKTPDNFGRFRDAYVQDGFLVIHTRCGGGNRGSYEGVFAEMQLHPLYVGDLDNNFDNTYADILFRFPEKGRDLLPIAWVEGCGGSIDTAWEMVEKLSKVPSMQSAGDRWKSVLESLERRNPVND